MKKYLVSLIATVIFLNTAHAQKSVLLETKYYSFQSNAPLNAHLYLYNRAMGCKFKKVQQDSLAYYSFKNKVKLLKPADLKVINSVVLFYKDTLISKDLLFDSLMRDLSDHYTKGTVPTNRMQLKVMEQVKIFQPYFNKLYWKDLEADNKSWVAANKLQLAKQEVGVVPELERIYQTKLPFDKKVIIDLTCYATWAGAFSYNDGFCHVIFASAHGSNKGELATEVIFHETSHFLVDKVNDKLSVLVKGKDIKKNINLWHNMIFYTTGYVLERQYVKEGKMFFPFYVLMKFEDKFPDFKATVEACKIYWDPYIKDQTELDDALQSIVNYIEEKK